MKKKILQRGAIGMLAGIVLSYLITICISLTFGTGEYYPCVPSLVTQVGSPIGAVIVQTVLSAVLGAVFGGASVIWEIDSWSILKQSLIYFLLSCIAMLPTAYLAHWMEHSLRGILQYVGIFVAIFLFVWLVQYFSWKIKIRKLNKHLQQ
ncbi:MAG: DUF3021 domain-containing protein [Lachnospiraceae bacterium]